MFTAKKINRRANQLYTALWKNNTEITITREDYYSPKFRVSFYVNNTPYQFHIIDNSLPCNSSYGEEMHTNSQKVYSFAARAIACMEFCKQPENYANTYDRCELVF